MPVAITPEQTSTTGTAPPRKAWTRRECELIESTGVFEGQRYELIEGDLINKMGMNEPHAILIVRLTAWLVALFGTRVRIQLPMDVATPDQPTNEPQPDACVTTPAASLSRLRPGPGDVSLVIEAADTTLAFDCGVKAALYARAGISDYWVIDINGRRIITHRKPVGDRYSEIVAYADDESVSPLAAPETTTTFRDLFD